MKPSGKIDSRSFCWLAIIGRMTKALVDYKFNGRDVYASSFRARCSACSSQKPEVA